jgi:uncharacterized repeat protein (TIGR02543 family)
MRKTLLLFTVLLFGLQGWATTFTVDGVTYTITDATNKTVAVGTQSGTAAISTSTTGEFTIPSSVSYNGDNYAVTAIGENAFYACSYLTTVNIPNSVTSIGYYAFFSCGNLASITIPNTVTSLRSSAFSKCVNLTSITIPSSVTSIGENVFSFCTKLNEITVDNNNLNYSSNNGVLFNKTQTSLIQSPQGNTNTSYTIPNSVTSIGDNAFYYSSNLATVNIPNSVTSIGSHAFSDCYKLVSGSIPNSVTSIGEYAFYDCDNLSIVNIPNSVISIGDYAFHYCSNLSSITIPSSVQSIGNSPFGGTSCPITVDENNSNYSSLDGVLYDKTKTKVINWPKAKTIFELPNSVTTFAYSSFVYSSFNSILIPNTITSINGAAFYNCSAKTLSIPNSVKSIGGTLGISSLTKIYVNNTDPANIILSSNSLENVSTSTCLLYVPTNSKSLYAAVSPWKNFTNIIEAALAPTISISPSQSSICPGSSVTFTATSTDGGDSPAYQWKINAIPITGATNSTYTTTALNNNDIITCDITSSLSFVISNSGTSNSIKMTVNPIVTPSVSITSSAAATYPGGSVTFTATPTNGGTAPAYQWYLNGTAISGATKSTYTSSTLSNNDVITCILTSSLPCTTTPTATSNTITTIVNNSFSSGGVYFKITSLTTPYTVAVTNVGSNSYSGNIIIPSSVTYGGTIFSVTSIADYAFLASTGLSSVTIPSSVTLIGKSIFQACSSLTSIIVDAANPNYYSDNVVLYNKQVTTLIECTGGKSGAYTIPSSVTSISESGFRDCAGLTSVTFPSSVTSIGDGAFASCAGITSVHVKNMNPSAILLGGSGVFYNIATTCSLYVPTGSKSLYAAAEQWGGFNIVEENGLYAVYTTASTGGGVTGSGLYNSGSSCMLTATAATGYTFTGWIENGTIASTNSSYTFTVNGTHTFVANFTANSYAIIASANSSTSGTVTSSGTYTYGSSCTLMATPSPGYALVNWTENGSIVSTSASYTFTVNAARTLVANFAEGAYSISISAKPDEGGTVTGGGTYLSGTSQTITAIANTYYGFKNWTDKKGNIVSTSSPFTFTLSKDTTLTANFLKTYDFSDANGLAYKISSPTTAYVTYKSPNGKDYSGFITIPSTVTNNGTSYNVTAIGDSAFHYCDNLFEINIPNSVVSIGDSAFYDCRGLHAITIPSFVTSIGNNAFYDCFNVSSITIPSSVTSIGYGAFNQCSKITSITIPNTITSIGNDVFNGCTHLTSVTIPSSVVSIGNSAFQNCSALTSVTIPSSVTSIGTVAFYGCDGLTNISIPSSITSIGSWTFGWCEGLTSVDIPNSITSIGDHAFYNCNMLTTISIPNSVTSIGYKALGSCLKLSSITVDSNNSNYSSPDGVLFNKALTTLIQYPAGKSNTSYVIPSTVTSIGDNAFDQIVALLSVTIPNSITSVGTEAFYYSRNLNTIYVNNAKPQNINLRMNVFSGVSTSTCKLYVPTGFKTLYAAANQWKDFVNTIEAVLTPSISISPSQSTICPGSSVTFTATPTDGGDSPTYQWKLNAIAISGATNSTYTTTALNNNDMITCDMISSFSCLVSNSATSNSIKMTVNPIVTPLVSITSSASATYPGGSVTFTATPTNGGIVPAYQWYLNGTAISGTTNSTYTSSTLSNNDVITCILTSSLPCTTTPTATSNAITMTVSNSFSSGGVYYKITSLTTPYTVTVTNIGSNSYSGNVLMPSSVTYGGATFSVTSIADYAFLASERLVSVTIPSSVTLIGKSIFNACSGLTSIIVDAANPNYYSDNVALYDKQVATLIECAGGKSGAYTIPSSVTSISESGFRDCAGLTSVTFPSSLTSIGDYAFLGCDGITSVILPSSVTSIGDGAFASCMGITSIHVKNMNPSAIVLGGISVFYNIVTSACSLYVPTGSKSLYATAEQWSKFNIVEEDGLYAVYTTANTGGGVTGSGSYNSGSSCTLTASAATGYTFTGWMENGAVVSTNSSYTFTVNTTHTFVANFTANSYTVTASASSNTSGTVTNSGTYTYGASCTLTAKPAAGYAFTNWTENGTIVSTSANYTFTVNAARTIVANFDRAYSITLSANSAEGGTVTGGGTFLSGTKQTITATANPYYGFKNWTDKKGNAISTSSPFIFTLSKDTILTANFVKKYDFTDSNGLYYKISSPTTAYVTYRNSAGGDYSGNITIPSTATINGTSYNVTAIGDSAFYNCSGLTSISIANSVTSIGRYSFSNCSSLPSITLSDVITSIGTYAFASCSNLRSVTLSNSLTSLSMGLFFGCSKLTSVTIPNSVCTIGENTFSACTGLISATIPASVVSLGIDAFEYCTGLTSITVENNNPNYCSVDGVLFNKNKTTLIQYPLANSQTSYSVPNSVTTIGQDAFERCLKLTTITIPSSVTSINNWAFYGCTGLTSIYATNIDPGKITLGGWVFNYISASTCTLYVPTGSKSLYAAASQWKAFTNIVEVPLYTITASVNTSTGSNVNGVGNYLSGTQCTISTVPNTGYSFANWTENGTVVSTDASYSFTVTANRALVANLTENNAGDYTIAMSSNPSVGGSTTGTGRYIPSATCIASATANTGYLFSNWTENGTVVSKDVTYTFAASTARTLVANFIAGYTVTAVSNSSTGGSVTGAGGYATGTSCTLTATANVGYVFTNWTENGNVVSRSSTYTMTVNSAHTLVANFIAGFTINATGDATQGSITGAGAYSSGSSCTLTATANYSYVFVNWTDNGTIVSTNANYSFTVNGTHTLVANFAKVYVISSSVSPTVRGTVTGSGSYVSGLSCTLTATANSSYVFVNWTENGVEVSKDASYTFTVDRTRTLVANFIGATSFINVTSSSTSKGTVTGGGTYTYGSTCTLTAAPKTGYVFTGWTENGAVVSTNPSYTFTVSAARSLVANFSAVTVTVTQPTAATLSGSIVITPSTGFTYSIDGKTYQTSNEFPYVSIGTYNVTLKNVFDGTVSSPVLAVINASGVVAANNYQIKASNCTCRDTKDGAIAVTLGKALDYTVTVTGINTGSKQSVMFSGTSYNLKNLPADTYKLVFKIDFLDNYEQSFNVVVTQPDDLSVLKVGAEKSRATYALSGGTNYYVSVNDNTTETQGDQVQVSLMAGENKIKIYTEKLCQGMYEETLYNSENGQISLFPNPTTGKITLGIPGEEESVTAEIISLSGAVELKQKLVVPSSRLVDLDVSDFSSGTYIVKVNGSTVHSSVKMVKK